MLLTPIKFQLTSVTIPDLRAEDPIDLFVQELDTEEAAKSRILAPRFYLKIYPPNNITTPPLVYYIHKDPTSLLFETVRMALTPSRGFGKVASYRVEYWQYWPLLNFTDPIQPSKSKVIKHQRFHEEWWYIPTVDKQTFELKNSFQPYNSNYSSFSPIFVNERKLVPVERDLQPGNLAVDIITTVDDMDILILQDGTNTESNRSYRDFTYSPEAQAISRINPVVTSIFLTRDQDKVDGDLINGTTETHIDYIRPLTREEILFSDSKDNRTYFPI